MKEVKFRIWDDPTSKMYFDVLVGNCNGENTCPCVFINEKGWVHTDNCIIEQFTGLHDKNGVEIYEGDKVIIEKEDDEEIFIVKWDNNTARFIMESETYILDFDNYNEKDFEVIGNIHEENENNDK